MWQNPWQNTGWQNVLILPAALKTLSAKVCDSLSHTFGLQHLLNPTLETREVLTIGPLAVTRAGCRGHI